MGMYLAMGSRYLGRVLLQSIKTPWIRLGAYSSPFQFHHG